MGLGKSITTLTAMKELRDDYLEAEKILVIAPKSVALNTWTSEASKWDHTNRMKVSVVMGTPAQREKALSDEADLYVTNRDNVVWICEKYKSRWPFDMVVLDESSSFKNFQSKRFKALWKVRPYIRRLVLLTGTPAPNGLVDLWAQIKLLDQGERLGRFIGQYRERYFHPGARNGAVVYEWKPNKGAKEKITEKISDICISMQASDYLSIPDIVDAGMTLQLPELERYRIFERECIMKVDDGEDIMAVTAVSLTNKLLQFASGAVYDDEHNWHEVSAAKLEALSDIMESTSENVLVFYNYRHELERISEEMKEYRPVMFSGQSDLLGKWNNGEIRMLLCHPASVAYGLNMQQGGHIIVWYSPTWNLELYQQANARLHRQGQQKPVMLYHLICKDTMDEVVLDALRSKNDIQESLMRHLKQRRSEMERK